MNDDRFNELLSGLLDDELSTEELAELVRLAGADPSREQEMQAQLETAEMIALSEDDLRDSSLFVSALLDRILEDPFVSRVRSRIKFSGRRRALRVLIPWSVAAAAVMALLAGGFVLWQPNEEPVIAELVEAEGLIQWTGEGGRIDIALEDGRPLRGGTLESLAPDAWAALRFPDNTFVRISGQSMLTISADPQKVLHLRRGNLSADVTPQPTGMPLVIHTPTARLIVLGTRLKVAANRSRTRLTVNEGRVRIRRLTDGSEIEVPASHQTLARLDDHDEMRVSALEGTTHSWRANLAEDATIGRWTDYLIAYGKSMGRAIEQDEMTKEEAARSYQAYAMHLREAGSLRAVPTRSGRDRREVLYEVALSVWRWQEAAPVVLAEDSTFRVRGEVQSPAEVTVGFSALDRDGASGGRYFATMRVEGKFNMELPFAEFQQVGYGAGATSALGRELVNWWCSSAVREAHLEITDVELFGPN